MTGVTPPVLTLSAGDRTLEIDTGELLFPGLVLAFCLFYYWDTRALPDLSMLYAGPLLYATTALAVITLVQQAVSLDGSPDEDGEGLGTATAITDPEPGSGPESEPEPEAASETAADRDAEATAIDSIFTVRNAALLVGLTTAYVVALEPVGFLIATAAYLAATLYLFGEESLFVLTFYSIGFSFLLWIVFIQWLRVPL